MLVLSIALVALFEAHSRALRTANIATNYAQARILGEALLADAVNGWNGKISSKKGVDSGFDWSVNITPETESWAKIETKNNWRLRHVRVRVSWGDGRQIELESLKLGRSNG
jgi:general secretion pathway protein I